MKTLIVYYSFTQNNEKLARHIQHALNCEIAKIETVKRRTGFSIFLDLVFNRKPALKKLSSNLRDYDHVIFIAPIWAGKIATPMRSFLTDEKANLKRYSFITLCGGGNPGQKENIKKELTSLVKTNPVKIVELWINNLVPAEKKDTIRNITGFRIEPDGFEQFESQIRDFIREEELVSNH